MTKFLANASSTQRSMAIALGGLAFYGLWAYLVNMQHGIVAGVQAACVQGSYSFALTFFMTLMIEKLYQRFNQYFDKQILAIITTISLSCAFIFSTSWLVNALAGTPEIFKTVILGYIIGGVYTVVYVVGLAKVKKITIGID